MAPEPNRICSICCRQLQLTATVCLPNKQAIFQVSSAQYPFRARVAVMYFTAQSCLQIVITYLRPPETDQNMPYLSLYHWPALNLAKFRENINSVEIGKFRGLTQNSAFRGKLWSLEIRIVVMECLRAVRMLMFSRPKYIRLYCKIVIFRSCCVQCIC